MMGEPLRRLTKYHRSGQRACLGQGKVSRPAIFLDFCSKAKCLLMGWSGRAPAPPAIEAGKGRQRQGACHVTESQQCDRGSRHRYWQEFIPHHWPGCARCDCAAAEVVAWPGRSPLCQHAAVSDRHGGLRRGASPQSQAQGVGPPRPTDAGEVCTSLLKGTEERLPRCGSDCRGGTAADDEVRRDKDRRAARFAGAAPGTRAIGQPAHRHHQSNPRLPVGARRCGASGSTVLAR